MPEAKRGSDPELPRYIAAIKHWAASKRRVRAVHLFGSRVSGSYHPDSDLDICVLAWPGDWEFDGAEWHEELAAALPDVTVHLVENQGSTSDLVRRNGHKFLLAYESMAT